MASFRKRNDKWQARVTKLGFPPQTKSFIVRSDAERWARGIERAMDMGEFKGKATSQPQTIGYLLKRYAEEVSETKRGADVEVIRLEAMQRTALAAIELSNITAPAVASYW